MAPFRKPPHPGARRAKVFCQVKNEEDIIGDWVDYHAWVFGEENLFVIDDGSSDRTSSILRSRLPERQLIVLPLRQNANWEELKMENLNALLERERSGCDFLIPLDADEFVICGAHPDRDAIHSELSRLAGTDGEVFKFHLDFNAVTLGDHPHPVREIVSFERHKRASNMKKSFFRAGTFRWVGLGQHYGYSASVRRPYVSMLGLMHYEWRGVRQALAKCLKVAAGTPRPGESGPRGARHYWDGLQAHAEGRFTEWLASRIRTSDFRTSEMADLMCRLAGGEK